MTSAATAYHKQMSQRGAPGPQGQLLYAAWMWDKKDADQPMPTCFQAGPKGECASTHEEEAKRHAARRG